MTADTRAALLTLGISEQAVIAMAREHWPAGIPKACNQWTAYDKRALPIFAANCLEPDWQDYYEQEYVDFIQWQKGR